MFFYLSLTSNNSETPKNFIMFLNKINQTAEIKLKIISSQCLTNKTSKRFTVLKSPHVNKKAQEHYSIFTIKHVIKLESLKKNKLLILFKKLRTYTFPEAGLRIKVIVTRIPLNKETLDPNFVALDPSSSMLTSNLQTYLKAVANFGEISFQSRFCILKKMFR